MQVLNLSQSFVVLNLLQVARDSDDFDAAGAIRTMRAIGLDEDMVQLHLDAIIDMRQKVKAETCVSAD